MASEIGTMRYVDPGPNIWGPRAPQEMAFEL